MEESQLSLHFSALNRNNPNITVNLNYLYLHNLIQHQASVDKSHAYENAKVSLDNCTIIVIEYGNKLVVSGTKENVQ